MNDIRWIQRLSNFGKALDNLREAVELLKTRSLSKLEEQGLIKAFELVHELAWNTIKDFYEEFLHMQLLLLHYAYKVQ